MPLQCHPKQCADKHLRPSTARSDTVAFILPSRSAAVSVRILHDFLRVRSRSISGSLLHWRISGGSKTFPEQSQTRVVVDSHRGLAAQRRFACRVLPSASIGRGNVRALAQRRHADALPRPPGRQCAAAADERPLPVMVAGWQAPRVRARRQRLRDPYRRPRPEADPRRTPQSGSGSQIERSSHSKK